jgi:Protein of unknown function (DUF3833)
MSLLASLCLSAGLALAALWVMPMLTGFRAQKPGDYKGSTPAFDPRRDLNGPILCEGVIYGPLGRVTSRFVARMEGKWEGNRGTLTEHFRYDSGVEQQRAWHLQLGNDGSIRADADDLVGQGRGAVEGGAVQLVYKLRLPKDAGGHVLNVTDWMYLAPNGTIMNRSQFTKFGVKVAELVATMRRLDA